MKPWIFFHVFSIYFLYFPSFPQSFTKALVRFVYARCGAQLHRPPSGTTAAAATPRRLKASEKEALRRAVQEIQGVQAELTELWMDHGFSPSIIRW